MDIYLNVKYKTIKFLKENIGENLHDFGLGKVFLEYQKQGPLNIFEKLDSNKMKNLYSVKDTIKRIKKAIDREKNICKVISNQGLNSI